MSSLSLIMTKRDSLKQACLLLVHLPHNNQHSASIARPTDSHLSTRHQLEYETTFTFCHTFYSFSCFFLEVSFYKYYFINTISLQSLCSFLFFIFSFEWFLKRLEGVYVEKGPCSRIAGIFLMTQAFHYIFIQPCILAVTTFFPIECFFFSSSLSQCF